MFKFEIPISFERLTGALVACALSFFYCATSATAATYDLESLFEEPEPNESVVFVAPGAGSDLSLQQREVVRGAMEAFATNQFDEMRVLGAQLTKSAPEFGEGWYILGLALANLEQYDQALSALSEAASKFEENTQPLEMKGAILESLQRPAEAVEAYKTATERDPSLYQLQEKIAIFAEATGDTNAAIERWNLSRAHAPEDRLFPHARLARLQLRLANPDAAIAVMTDYLDRDRNDQKAMMALGYVQLEAGEYDAAIASFADLWEQSPEEPLAALYLARSLVSAGRLEDAGEVLQEAAERLPTSVALSGELARVLGAQRDYEGAVAAFDAALRLEPNSPEYLRGNTIAHLRIDDLDGALENAKQLAALQPDNADALIMLASVQDRSGLTDEAISSYETALSKAPENWIAANNLANLLLETASDQAVELAENAVRLSQGQTSTRSTLGRAYLAASRADEAVEVFAALSAENVENAAFVYLHGRALIEAGDAETGKTRIAEALQLDENFEGADDARSLLNE